MIRPDQIPEDVLKVLDDHLYDVMGEELEGEHEWQRKILADVLNAWPGWEGAWYDGNTATAIMLPLPQEKANE